MALGDRLKQARQEAGLSQRQLCGEAITRNMLSQIENGSAKPSMDTLRYLASQLGKPVSYFLEEAMPELPNQQVMDQARQATGTDTLEILERYQGPDSVFDRERWLLEALTCLELARQAVREDKKAYALSLLERAKAAGQKTPYYTAQLERERLLLCHGAGASVAELVQSLNQDDRELLLLADAALQAGQPERAGKLLDAAQEATPYWHFLRGQTLEATGDHQQAVEQYLLAKDYGPMQVYGCLERCYQAMEDYKQAYFYACLQR